MLCTQDEASWTVNTLDYVPKTIHILEWMGDPCCSFDLHSMIVSRPAQAFPRAGMDSPSPHPQEMLNWHHRELSAEKRDWWSGRRRELERGIRFLTPCSSCHSLASSKIFNDFLLLKGLKSNLGWHFRRSLICPLRWCHKASSCWWPHLIFTAPSYKAGEEFSSFILQISNLRDSWLHRWAEGHPAARVWVRVGTCLPYPMTCSWIFSSKLDLFPKPTWGLPTSCLPLPRSRSLCSLCGTPPFEF